MNICFAWSAETLETFGFNFLKSETLCFWNNEVYEEQRQDTYNTKPHKQYPSSKQLLQKKKDKPYEWAKQHVPVPNQI